MLPLFLREKFIELEPYILLQKPHLQRILHKNIKFREKELKISGKFNQIFILKVIGKNGFSEKQSAAIVKYKNYLGGSFLSKEKFKECLLLMMKITKALSLPYVCLKKHRK